jgi:hypothetical protein
MIWRAAESVLALFCSPAIGFMSLSLPVSFASNAEAMRSA